MNVASKDLCEELYKVSGWDFTFAWYNIENGNLVRSTFVNEIAKGRRIAAYDSGYLLAKLDGIEHDVTIPKDRLADSSNYLAELHIKRFKSEWRKIDGIDYEVSNLGEVRHAKSKRPRKLWANKEGYVSFAYHWQGGYKNMFVHIAVMKAFKTHPEGAGYQVNHIDRNPANNEVSNLEWCTLKENVAHAIKGGKFKYWGRDK